MVRAENISKGINTRIDFALGSSAKQTINDAAASNTYENKEIKLDVTDETSSLLVQVHDIDSQTNI